MAIKVGIVPRASLRTCTCVARLIGPVRYWGADLIGRVLFYTQAGRAERTISGHRRRDPNLSEKAARALALGSFCEYARTTVDFVWANDMAAKTVRRYSTAHYDEYVKATQELGTGGIFALSHFGNWDMAANIAMAHGVPLTTVMAPIGSKGLTDLIIWARQKNDLEVFKPEHAARGLIRALQRKRCVALLCDIPNYGPTVEVPYCGGKVTFSAAPAWLAKKMQVPLFPVACWRGEHGYEIRVHPPVEIVPSMDEAEIMSKVAEVLEVLVSHYPTQWYPFNKVYVDED